MTTPIQITFPVVQGEIAATYKTAFARYHELQTEMNQLQALFTLLRHTCKHPNSDKYNCPDCGHSND